MPPENAIQVKHLKKSFKRLVVLDDVDFSVKRGSILALLGPNGAGKTTAIRILSTLLLPDTGTALINGRDVVKQADAVRHMIGLTGQYAAVDEYLTGEENLHMMGRLYHMDKKEIKRRSDELLGKFELLDAANRVVKTYSGGMRRRLDLAASLIASPPILFLDEPTTGLDPRSRFTMWKIIKDLADAGTTILLTTQYMDEADRLADMIVVIDNGKVIAKGTPKELKQRVGSEMMEITIAKAKDFERVQKALGKKGLHLDSDRQTIGVAIKGGVHQFAHLLSRLNMMGVDVESVSLRSPTLDDVFMALTGRSAEEGAQK